MRPRHRIGGGGGELTAGGSADVAHLMGLSYGDGFRD